MRPHAAFPLALLSLWLAIALRAAEPTLVAVLPEALWQQKAPGEIVRKDGATLAERVQLFLSADPAWAFVERATLQKVEAELALAHLTPGGDDASASVRLGRLNHAGWSLVLRLRADDLARPRIEVDVIDTLRADLLARETVPLDAPPNESWIMRPSENAVRLAAGAAARALAAADARQIAVAGRTVVAPLTFVNKNADARLAPLGGKLLAAFQREASGVRVLGCQSPDEAIAESALFQAGLTDLDGNEWSHVADVFVWGEFSEDPGFAGEIADLPVTLTLHVWRDENAPRSLVLRGKLGALDQLAREGAQAALDAARGGKIPAETPARHAAAAQLLESARRLERKHAPGQPPEPSAARVTRERARLRYLDLAAFFAPDDLAILEQRVAIGLSLIPDEEPRRRWHAEFWRGFDRFLIGPEGRPDFALIARAAGHDAAVPGYAARFLRIGQAWQSATNLDEMIVRKLGDNFLGACLTLPDETGQAAALAALWPVLIQLDPDLDPASIRARPWRSRAIKQIYAGDPEGLRTLLARKPTPAPDAPAPAAVPSENNRAIPALSQPASVSRPVRVFAPDASPSLFTRWEQAPIDGLLARAETGPSVTRSLETPWLEFSPWQLVARATGFSPSRAQTRLQSVALRGDNLWIAFQAQAGDRRVALHHSARIDLRTHELLWLSELASGKIPVTDIWPDDERVWFATRGEGVRVFNPQNGASGLIDSAKGLSGDEPAALLPGREALFVAMSDPAAPAVSRVELATGKVSQVAAPFANEFPGLPAAARAAIASFGDDAPRVVKLPDDAFIGFERSGPPAPITHPLLPFDRDNRFVEPQPLRAETDPSIVRAWCVTGPRDGYWIAAHHSVFWVSGTRRTPLAHWLQGEIINLADDGRHLFLMVLRRPALAGPGTSPSASYRGSARLYAYDHVEGRWLGWFTPPSNGLLTATPGLLAIGLPEDDKPLVLINTGALSGSVKIACAPGAAPQDAITATGWTPLLAALWRDDPAEVRRLLDSGARRDAADARGWHPLQLAAAWSSPACLRALLDPGSPVGLAAPARDPRIAETYRAGFLNTATALHAAVGADRVENVRILLAAGADPLAQAAGLGTPLDVAVRRASPAVVDMLLQRVPDPPWEQLAELARSFRRPDLKERFAARQPAVATPDAGAQLARRLYDALADGPEPDLPAMRAALEAGADPCVGPAHRDAPLRAAAINRRIEAIETMIPYAKAPGLNQARPRSESTGLLALRAALASKRPDLARRLLAAGTTLQPRPAGESPFSEPLLLLAAHAGDGDLARQIRAAGFPATFPTHSKAIHEAVRQKNAPLLQALLSPPPADHDVIDNIDTDGRSPLFIATDFGWTEGVRLLLAADADTDTRTSRPHRHLRDAAIPWPEISLLINRRPDAPDNRLAGAQAVAAVNDGDRAVLAALAINHDVLAYRDYWQWSVLHHAAHRGRADLVRRLLAARAAPDALTTYGESPLCLAVFGGDQTTVELLLDTGAKVNLRQGEGWLPLHAAAAAGRADLVARLLRRRADPAPGVGPHAEPALLLAAKSRGDDLQPLKLLLAAGASINATDAEGAGVMEASVLSDSPEKIQYLLGRGATWRLPVSEDYHPMDVAARRGLVGSIRKLQQLGLQSPRALSLAKDDATRAALQDDDSAAGRRHRADEEQWPAILADPDRWRERLQTHLKAGGNVNHRSAKWGTPLRLALLQNSPVQVAALLAAGADPSVKTDQVIGVGPDNLLGWEARATALYGWFGSQQSQRTHDDPLPPARDQIALDFLPTFWPHDKAGNVREAMLDDAEKAGLPRAATWMRAHLRD